MTSDLQVLARYLGWSGFTDYVNSDDKHKICYVAGINFLSENDNGASESISEEYIKKKIKFLFNK